MRRDIEKTIIRFGLAATLLAALCARTTVAATYYVKPTGNDTYTGLTEALAWQHVQMACTTLVAGDMVLIRAGTYDEESPYSLSGNINCGLRPKNSGSPGLPIVFKGYSGDVRPIIKGVIGERNMATLYGRDYITLDSLEFRSGYRGIYTWDSDSLVVKYCVIDSSRGPTGGNNNGGVTTFTGNAASIRWLTVYACSLFANGDDGSYTAGFNSSGVHLYGCTDCLFRRNVIYDESAGINFKGHTNEPSFYNCLVDSNVIYNIDAHACVVGSFGEQDSIVFCYNTIYNAANSGLAENSMSDQPIHIARRIYVYNNTFDCDSIHTGLRAQYAVRLENFYCFNNIIYKPRKDNGDYNGVIAFKNYNYNNECCTYPNSCYIDYNLYKINDSSTTQYFVWTLGAAYTYTQWKALDKTAQGLLAGQDSHSSLGNPLFISISGRDYHIDSTGPAASGGRGGVWPSYRGAYRPSGYTPPAGYPPVAAFSGTPTSGTVALTVNFTDASTKTPTSWSWTFGDGGTSTSKNPSHSFAAAGTYTVTLTATNAYGSDGETKAGYITVGVPPVADFSEYRTSDTTALGVNFTDQSTNIPTSWSWTFGDGGTSTSKNPSHRYTSAGNYEVSLTVSNIYGGDQETKTVDVTPPTMSAVQAASITSTGAVITWTTNEAATSRIDYGLTTNYGSQTALDGNLATSHSQGLSALSAGTLYNYRVRSRDAAGNEAVSGDFTFTTAAASSNLALGILPSVCGTYSGYSPASATDGNTNSSWASDDSSTSPHWIEINFGSTKTVRRVVMRWAWNSSQSSWMTSQRYQIQSWNGTSFVDALVVSSPPVGSVTDVSFSAVSTSHIRIYQPTNMGPATYSVILWVSEVEAYEAAGSDAIPPATVGDLNGR